MKIAVMGAGAVGSYYGGLLARAGHAVTLIARAAHVEAIRRDGLRLQTAAFDERVAVQADTEPAAVRDAELVLFCVKSTDTERAGASIAPHLRADALVLCLQNGVGNAERLQALLTQTVEPVVVYVAVELPAPGQVRHHGRGELVVAPAVAARGLDAVFAAAGIPMPVSDNVVGALWLKLLVNCVYNALSAITQLPYGQVVKGVGIESVMRDLMNECLAVAQAEGVTLPGDAWAAVEAIARTIPAQHSSTAQDLARHRRTEIDHLNGHIVRRGEAHGVATPVNRALHALVRLIESRDAAPTGAP